MIRRAVFVATAGVVIATARPSAAVASETSIVRRIDIYVDPVADRGVRRRVANPPIGATAKVVAVVVIGRSLNRLRSARPKIASTARNKLESDITKIGAVDLAEHNLVIFVGV